MTFATLQSLAHEIPLAEQISTLREENNKGANIVAQIALRGNGIIMGWQTTVPPFLFKSGQVTFRDGTMQGPTPGGVLRGQRGALG